ncbi:MAG: DUF2807 domain-containing protein [Pseudomonadota bacterium]|nr:DUF2807 domain-containing protein [Pseudomonadota bacterium]
MKRILAAAALAALAVPAAAAERRYTVTDFDRIVIEGPFNVRLATGGPSSAVATGTPEALERVSVEVQGRTLRIRPNRSAWGGYQGTAAGPVALEVTTRELRSATVTGPGNLAIDRAESMRLDLAVEGSGRIGAGQVAADNLVVGLLGSGRVQVAGTARELRASIHGWADLDAAGLTARDANITTDTAGRIAVAVERQATVTAGGIGEVAILGTPACTVRGPSAGLVVCGDRSRR